MYVFNCYITPPVHDLVIDMIVFTSILSYYI